MSFSPSFDEPPAGIRDLSRDLRRFGWIGFWVQLVFACLASLTILMVFLDRRFNLNQVEQRSSFGLFLACIGLLILGFAIYWCWRYTRLGQQLRSPRSRPSLKTINHSLRIGLIANLAGMVFTAIATEWNVGMLLLKVLSVPQGAAVYASGLLIEPLDIFVVQSKINLIVAQLAGIIVALWLLRQVSRCFDAEKR